jgi:hypothetical protein
LGVWGAWLAPVIGILGGIAAHWLVIQAAPTDRERRVTKIAFISLWVFVLLWCVVGQLGMRALSQRMRWTDQTYFAVMAGYWWLYAVICATLTIVMFRRFLALRQQSEKAGEVHRPGMRPFTPVTNAVMVGGTCLAVFSWLIWVAWQARDAGAAVIIAGLMVGLGIWNYLNLRGKIGMAAMRAVAGHLTLAWATVLVILNLRLNTWLAAAHRSSLAEIHHLLPAWVTPLLTLALVLWAGLVLALTKPASHG